MVNLIVFGCLSIFPYSIVNSFNKFPLIKQSNKNPVIIIPMTNKCYQIVDSSPASSMKISKIDFDSDRVNEIFKSLNQIFTKDLCKMIGTYEKFISLDYLHDAIMNKLDPLGKRKKDLNLENPNFLKNLNSIIMKKWTKFRSNYIIWIDLGGFLVKFIIYLK